MGFGGGGGRWARLERGRPWLELCTVELRREGAREAGRPGGGDGWRAALGFWQRGRQPGQVGAVAPIPKAMRGGAAPPEEEMSSGRR